MDIDYSPPSPGSVAVILPAAGSGRRFGSHRNKLFATLNNNPLWYIAASRLRKCSSIGRIVMPVSADDQSVFASEFADQVQELGIEIVLGGAQRTDSVQAGLDTLADDESARLVAVHDAARPLVRQADLSAVIANACQSGAAILASPVAGTIKRKRETGICTVDRSDLWVALTPQVFRRELLQRAYQAYRGRPATDDAELVERLGYQVALVKGSADNLKITLPEDLLIAEAILSQQNEHV